MPVDVNDQNSENEDETNMQDSVLEFLGLELETEEDETKDGTEDEDNSSEEESDESDEVPDGEEEDESDGTEEKDSNDESDGAESGEGDESPKDELTELRERNAKLLKLIEDGVTQTIQPTAPKVSGEQGEVTQTVIPKSTEVIPALAELVGEIDFNEMQDDPNKFVELLQKVVDHTRQSTIDGLRAELPGIVNTQTSQALGLRKLTDDFYRDNQDLAAVKKTVSAVAMNVGTENPEFSMAQVLEESAKRTRTMLGLKDPTASPKAKAKMKRNGKRPAMPTVNGKRSGKSSGGKRSAEQKQIDDLIS